MAGGTEVPAAQREGLFWSHVAYQGQSWDCLKPQPQGLPDQTPFIRVIKTNSHRQILPEFDPGSPGITWFQMNH